MTPAPDRRQSPSEAGLRGGDRTVGRRHAWTAGACCLAILAAGCGSVHVAAATGSPPPSQGSSAVTTVSRAALRVMAREYLKVARPANRRLDTENDGYEDAEHDNLAQATADLRAETATERHFDRQLLRLKFPSWIAMTARALVRANNRRITLTRRQAGAMSLAALRAFDHRHKAADAAVENQVRLIRQFLGLPPPSGS
jgi:hypothetical protein